MQVTPCPEKYHISPEIVQCLTVIVHPAMHGRMKLKTVVVIPCTATWTFRTKVVCTKHAYLHSNRTLLSRTSFLLTLVLGSALELCN